MADAKEVNFLDDSRDTLNDFESLVGNVYEKLFHLILIDVVAGSPVTMQLSATHTP